MLLPRPPLRDKNDSNRGNTMVCEVNVGNSSCLKYIYEEDAIIMKRMSGKILWTTLLKNSKAASKCHSQSLE